MGSLGPVELAILAMLGLLLFGPERLISVARSLGKSITEFRRAAAEIQEQITQVTTEVTEPLQGLEEPSTTVQTWESWTEPEPGATATAREWRDTPWRRQGIDAWRLTGGVRAPVLRRVPGIARFTHTGAAGSGRPVRSFQAFRR